MWVSGGGGGRPASSPPGVCSICQHGALGGEQLNPDGTCPYQVIAVAENQRVVDARMQAEIERITRDPAHLRPGMRP